MTPFEWTLAAMGWSALEYWLGKTNVVKAGSVVELVLHGVDYVFGRGFPK